MKKATIRFTATPQKSVTYDVLSKIIKKTNCDFGTHIEGVVDYKEFISDRGMRPIYVFEVVQKDKNSDTFASAIFAIANELRECWGEYYPNCEVSVDIADVTTVTFM